MPQLQQASVRNRLLAALPPEDFGLLQPHLEPVSLELRHVLLKANAPMEQVYFLDQGIISALADTSQGRIEVGLIGREGMVGVPVVLGADRSPHTFLVQASGTALRIRGADLRTAMRNSASLSAPLMLYVHAFLVQTAETAYANAGFTLEARLARWVLMTDDRLEGGDLPLTHEFLSMMLGVRRPGVTAAIQMLESNGLIRASRGRITVLNRAGLEKAAGDAYGVSKAEYVSVLEQAPSPMGITAH
jgi:CRP-like cAMP-binding protein